MILLTASVGNNNSFDGNSFSNRHANSFDCEAYLSKEDASIMSPK